MIRRSRGKGSSPLARETVSCVSRYSGRKPLEGTSAVYRVSFKKMILNVGTRSRASTLLGIYILVYLDMTEVLKQKLYIYFFS